jgi:TRAP-type mannitol/chloroaromatic compound transport system substrate-binding protein
VPAAEETDGLMTGVLDAATCCGGYAMHLDPAASLFDSMSGGLTSVQLGYWFRTGGGYEFAREMYEQWGIYFAAEMLLCPEDWAYTTVELNTVDDLKKLKMRTAGYGGEILDRLGASTVFLPGGELYESMQRGVINAFEYMAAKTGWEMAFHEVSDYLYLSYTRAPSDGCNYLVNQESLNELPEDLQDVVRYVSENEMTFFYDSMIMEDAAYLEKWRDYGVEVKNLPKEVEDAFIAEAGKFFDDKKAEYGADSYFAKIVDSQREFKHLWESAGIH